MVQFTKNVTTVHIGLNGMPIDKVIPNPNSFLSVTHIPRNPNGKESSRF